MSNTVTSDFVTILRDTARNLYKGKRGVFLAVDATRHSNLYNAGTVYFGFSQLDRLGNETGNPRYIQEASVKVVQHSEAPVAKRYVATQSQGYTGEIVGALTSLANIVRPGDELVVTFTFGSKRKVVDDGEGLGTGVAVIEDTADLTVTRKGKGIATFRIETVLRASTGDYSFATNI